MPLSVPKFILHSSSIKREEFLFYTLTNLSRISQEIYLEIFESENLNNIIQSIKGGINKHVQHKKDHAGMRIICL